MSVVATNLSVCQCSAMAPVIRLKPLTTVLTTPAIDCPQRCRVSLLASAQAMALLSVLVMASTATPTAGNASGFAIAFFRVS